jgi:hypothetical protein
LIGAENKRVGLVLLAQYGGHPPAGRWQRYSIPIAAMEGTGKMTMKPVYIDDVVLKP